MAGSFSISLEKFAIKTEKQAVVVCQKIAMEAFKRVIEKSPVDTGRFRANWGCSIGSPYVGTTESFDKSGGATIGKAVAVTAGWNGKGSILLVNNMSYGPVLEFGRANGQPGSKQAPNGMVRITVAEMQNGAAEAAIR